MVPVNTSTIYLFIEIFFIDAYLFLNSEEMSDLLNTVINRAVRYYGVIHDIILEILEILSGR
jgi:hypothetical protein